MKLIDNWKQVLQKAWSIRLIILTGFFSGLEVAVPYLEHALPIPTGLFATLSFGTTVGAFATRLLSQSSMTEPKQ